MQEKKDFSTPPIGCGRNDGGMKKICIFAA